MLSREEKIFLLKLARQSILSQWEDGGGEREPGQLTPNLQEARGAFVTLRRDGQLRGCIGRLTSCAPLWETVRLVAKEAAFSDPRFPPLQPFEFSLIDLEISVLTPLEKVSPSEIEVGKHGLLVVKGSHRGVLLPQVATEHGWDRETFLAHTAMKAGLPPDGWKGAEVYRFSAEVFSEKELGLYPLS